MTRRTPYQAFTRLLACGGIVTAACSGPDEAELPPLPPRVEATASVPRGEERPFRELVVAFTGEVRGEIEPCGCPTVPYGGFARRATLLSQLRAEGVPVFVLDAGEMLVKGLAALDVADRAPRARAVLDLSLGLGLDAWAPGPTDVRAAGLSGLGDTHALAATWRNASSEAVFPPSTVVERDGVRLGVIGLGARAEGLTEVDPVEAAKAAMVGDADTWVALSNLDAADARRVAEAVPGLGAVLSVRGGELDPPTITKGAPILEAPDRGRYLSILRVALGSDGAAWEVTTDGPARELARERERVARLPAGAREAADARVTSMRAALAETLRGHDLAYVEDRPLGSDLDQAGPLDDAIAAWKDRSAKGAHDRVAAAPTGPAYAGSGGCSGCHSDRFTTFMLDPHARAYEALIPRKQELDVECVGCHTTGWGQQGGNGELTALAMRTWKGVQCEACHGPMAGHPRDPDVHSRPVTTATCRSCHDTANSPSFDEARYRARISCTAVSRREADARTEAHGETSGAGSETAAPSPAPSEQAPAP